MTILMTILAILAGVGGGLVLAAFAAVHVAKTNDDVARVLELLDTTHPKLWKAIECGITAGLLAAIALVALLLAPVVGTVPVAIVGVIVAVQPVRMLFGI